MGNHEGENDFYLGQTPPNNLAIWGTQWRKYYYPNPYPNSFYSGNDDVEPYGVANPENYYAWTWGDALFVVLDVYRNQNPNNPKPQGWEWSLGVKQYNWLKTTLEKAHLNISLYLHIIIEVKVEVGLYRLNYLSGVGMSKMENLGFDKNRPGWGKPIHQLFKDNGVNIFFQGHDHLFAHEVMDGVHYQEVPMPSDSTYMIGKLANADAFVSDTLDGTGHIRVSVSSSCVKVDYVKAYLPKDTLDGKHKNREIGFSYTIGSCIVTGINDLPSVSNSEFVEVFPNPAKNKLFLRFINNINSFEAKLININGDILLKSNNKEIDVSGLQPGIYFLNVQAGNQVSRKKIIISN